MEKQNYEKEVFKTISKKKFFFFTLVLLVIFSGFLLFNQISYLNSVYDENRNKVQAEKVK